MASVDMLCFSRDRNASDHDVPSAPKEGTDSASALAALVTKSASTMIDIVLSLIVHKCLAKCNAFVFVFNVRRRNDSSSSLVSNDVVSSTHRATLFAPPSLKNSATALGHPRVSDESPSKAFTRHSARRAAFRPESSDSNPTPEPLPSRASPPSPPSPLGSASPPSPCTSLNSGATAPHSTAASCAFKWFCTVVPTISAAAARRGACGDDRFITTGTRPPIVCRSPPLSTEQTRSFSSCMSSSRASMSSWEGRTASASGPMAAAIAFILLISSTIPFCIACRNHARSASEMTLGAAAPSPSRTFAVLPSSVCASDHFSSAFQLRSFPSAMASRAPSQRAAKRRVGGAFPRRGGSAARGRTPERGRGADAFARDAEREEETRARVRAA